MNEMNDLKLDIENSASTSSTLQEKLKWIIPLVVILISAVIIYLLVNIKPEKKRKKNNLTPPLTVSVFDVESQAFQVKVNSYGNVSPRTQSFIVAQVDGQIIEVSNRLREGSFFKKGDILLNIDDRDSVADVLIAEASLADAEQALAEEEALSSQALFDWKNLGNKELPSDLVLRKPQLQAAKARLTSAQASLTKTKLVLERTEIVAPYDGRVLEKIVGLGEVISANTQVAEVYATDYFEVRLPLNTSDLKFVHLPETFQETSNKRRDAEVSVFSSLSESPTPWSGELVRAESAIDGDARQLHVVVQIDSPFSADIEGRTPLKIGEYVTAQITGKVIDDAIVIPTQSIYQNSYVYVVSDNIIKRKEIQIQWQDDEHSLIGAGLDDGDRIVVTTLGQVSSGTRVKIEGEEQRNETKVAHGE